MKMNVYVSEKCMETMDSRPAGSCCCQEDRCILQEVNSIRDSDFNLLLEESEEATEDNRVSAFVCSANDFEKLAKRRSSMNVGVLIPVDLLGEDGCETLHRCIDVARRRRSFLALWNLTLVDKRICVSLSQERKLPRVNKQIRWMGGFVERSMNDSVTHLVCDSSSSEAYKAAVARGFRCILTLSWLMKCWTLNDATIDDQFIFKMFSGLSICLRGFSSNDLDMLEREIVDKGGKVSRNSSRCTHIVLRGTIKTPKTSPEHIFAVSDSWLQDSLNSNLKVDEELYYLNESTLNTSCCSNSGAKSRSNSDTPRKRGFLSALNTVLSPRSSLANQSDAKRRRSSRKSITATNALIQKKTAKLCIKRMYRIQELYNTECNYIDILEIIIKLQRQLSEHPILSSSEVNKMFGKVEPIRSVHSGIRTRLREIMAGRQPDAKIGEIFLNLEEDLTKAYTPYVNFLEEIRDRIVDLRHRNQKFAEFVRVIESDCCPSRQGFTDLLVKPVQRLASIIVLLDALLDVTPIDHEDHQALTDAVKAIRKVAASINRSKEVVEEGRLLLSLVNDIQGCPPNLCSRHRRLLFELTVREISDVIASRDHTLNIFVFSDCLEIAKMKRHAMSRLSSFRGSILNGNGRQKQLYKHALLLNMTMITNIHLFDPNIVQDHDTPIITIPAISVTFRDEAEMVDVAAADAPSVARDAEIEGFDGKNKTFVFQINHARSYITQRLSYYAQGKEGMTKVSREIVEMIVQRVVEMKCLKDRKVIDELTQPLGQIPIFCKKNWRKSITRRLSRVFSNSTIERPKLKESMDDEKISTASADYSELTSGIFTLMSTTRRSSISADRNYRRKIRFVTASK
ncbi:hypothetical protein ACOME3_004982 [Neoechinorhynchus agilis]